jgi:CRISPR-associated endonuclease Csn1
MQRLSTFGNNSKEAFKDLSNNPIWMNQEKGVAIKSVRCFTGLSDLQPLHKNTKGEDIDFVSTRNNHHMAVYKDDTGKLFENTVTFWDALERKKAGLPVIVTNPKQLWTVLIETGFDNQEILNKLPKDNWTYVTSLQQNEMIVFGLNPSEVDFYSPENYAMLSKHLYRVQKMSKKSSGAIDVWFRHHLETKLDDTGIARDLKKFINARSLAALTGAKVKVNNLGQICWVENSQQEGDLSDIHLAEPVAEYSRLPRSFKKITVSTLEEQQRLNDEYSKSLSPEQRLTYLKELNDKAFGIKSPPSDFDKKIKFN